MRSARILALLLVVLCVAAVPAHALSHRVILELRDTAHARYPQGMPAYTVLVYRGKAYAATRGAGTVAVWEYDGGQWQWVFDHPLHPPDTKAVNEMYRNYGFTMWQERRLHMHWKRFPGG